MPATVVVGAQWGDEGKGKLTDLIAKEMQLVVRYQGGLFLPEKGLSSIEVAAAEQDANELFLTLLDRYMASGRNVSHKEKSRNYAPRVFAATQTQRGSPGLNAP